MPLLGRRGRVERQAGRGSRGPALPVASGSASTAHYDDPGNDDDEDRDAADGDAERHGTERLDALLQSSFLQVRLHHTIQHQLYHTKRKCKVLDTCYSTAYMSQTHDQQRFTISKVAAD